MRGQSLVRPPRVCQFCAFLLGEKPGIRPFPKFSKSAVYTPQGPAIGLHSYDLRCTSTTSRRKTKTAIINRQQVRTENVYATSKASSSISSLTTTVESFLTSGNTRIPSENTVLAVLKACGVEAQRLTGNKSTSGEKADDGSTPATALLSLEENIDGTTDPAPKPIGRPSKQTLDSLSDLAFKIVTHPNVFITPAVLKAYTTIQSLLRRPDTFPDVFALYATKPIPQPNTNPIKYTHPSPNKVQFAIPASEAQTALATAVETKNLPAALEIIETSFATTSFRRNKIIREAGVPLLGFSVAPMAAYALASQLSVYQDTMDPAMATNIAFVGILAYFGFTATLGVVAITTANDQMDRVTWSTGMPLRERWVREPERAALDRVAGAWGFKDQNRRGEEEGEEWDMLREWIGRRGMVLDKVSLMEGME